MRKTNRAVAVLMRFALLSALLLTAAACGDGGERKDGEEIIVAAAANLTDAFGEVGRRFTARTGVRVTFSFGATADLAKQIENGAPFDVFASADVARVDELVRKGMLTEESRAIYARGRLVLWAPPAGRAPVARMEDLAGAGVTRIALAKPEAAPYGRAAVESLQALRLWAAVEPKVVYSQSVAQAKQFAASGNADAAFLPRSLVMEGEGTAVEVDASLHAPLDQALGVVRASAKQSAAKSFAEFVLGEEGQTVLKGFGYDAPPKR
ncbi:MAG: molybdate ABC transporter substrate-binding protein [Pyrinomonadaceae bacterium]